MKYDFTSIMERSGQDAAAVDCVGKYPADLAPTTPKEGFDYIPMGVADMNFPTCPTIPEAIIARTKQPHYGYFLPRDEYFTSIIDWQRKRHGVEGLTPECIGYENGVHGGNVTALRVICSRGGKVLLHTPAYASFIRNLKDLGYNGVFSEMYRDEDGVWRMDFEDTERKIVENDIHAAIFCSPHNPTGRIWERWEVEKFMEICKKHDVYVVSDEIWADLVLTGHKHIPLQSVSEDARQRTIAMYAPSKTFNLAGLVGSYHIIYNKTLRDRFAREATLTHYNNINVLSMHALLGAYKPEGHEWVDELCEVLTGNAAYAYHYIKEHFEG
ncbi:MAG: aminotransferase class I/II-fold pyridoxal phosphate-dependent enzyme, partial [Butyricicoccus sp.]|nr:aminotransferase class I/II-fold pyridoxal phosphate-dependent enzyme [Butyricicoccus sp.]